MKYGWLILSLFCCLAAFGQNSSKVKRLENQRKQALAEIEMTNQLLNETKKTARSSLNRLNLLSQQILSRKKVINILNEEIGGIDNQIGGMQSEINSLEEELKVKQKNYGKSVKGMYKRRSSQDKILFILSADNFAQSLRRMRYLREYATWQKQLATEIYAQKNKIEQKKSLLQKTRYDKVVLLSSRENENKKLQSEEENQKTEVQQLNKKQRDLQAQLNKKKRQAEMLNQQIENQIAIEIARAEAAARAAREKAERERAERARIAHEKAIAAGKKISKKEKEKEEKIISEPIREERVAEVEGGYAMTREEKKLSDNFAGNKGRLPYPVTGRYTIVGSFGEQQHQELKYVRTSNSGIDIQTTPGADARCVFNGEVTRVFVVPGYNNSVIIRHGNYLTVYSNLSQVYVKAGDRVSTRQSIGKIFTDTEDSNATVLNFQLWKEKTKLNPASWLN